MKIAGKGFVTMLDKWYQTITKEHALIGISITRIFFGIAILYIFLINYPTRYLLWGAHGLYPYSEYHAYVQKENFFTLFDLSSSDLFIDIFFTIGILAAIGYIVGYHTRFMGILLAVLIFSLYYRNPEITHGGDNILRIMLIYLIFARVNAYFSLDAMRAKKLKENPSNNLFNIIQTNETWQAIRAVFHNFAWIACILQLACLYFAAGAYKMMGDLWQSGTALYYASRVQDFYTPHLTELLWMFEPMIVFMTYFTIVFQVSFPFLLLNRYTKYLAIVCACSFHLGIAVFMGLADFSWIMIGCEFMLLLDHEYRKIYQFISKLKRRTNVAQKQAA